MPHVKDDNLFAKMPLWLAALSELKGTDKVVWCVLNDAVGRNADAWPGIRAIARRCGIGSSTAQRCVNALEFSKLVAVARSGSLSGLSNRYTTNTARRAQLEHAHRIQVGHGRRGQTEHGPAAGVPRTTTAGVFNLNTEPDPYNQTPPPSSDSPPGVMSRHQDVAAAACRLLGVATWTDITPASRRRIAASVETCGPAILLTVLAEAIETPSGEPWPLAQVRAVAGRRAMRLKEPDNNGNGTEPHPNDAYADV